MVGNFQQSQHAQSRMQVCALVLVQGGDRSGRVEIVAQGLDPENLPAPHGLHRPNLPEGVKAWRNVWSGGHSTGLIDDVPTVAELAARFEQALADDLEPGWQSRVAGRLGLPAPPPSCSNG